MLFKTDLMRAVSRRDSDALVLSNGEGLQLFPSEVEGAVLRFSAILESLEANGIAISMDNSPAWVVVDLAALESGIWTLPLPPFFNSAQRQNALDNSACEFLITDTMPENKKYKLATEVAGSTLYITETYSQKESASVQPKTAKVTFTSGSTGNPKGLCLSLQNMSSTALAVAEKIGELEVKNHVSVLPLAVLLENVAGVYAALLAGVPCIVPSLRISGMAAQPTPNCSTLFSLLSNHNSHSCILVPELLKGLCEVALKGKDVTTLDSRFLAVGGARVGEGLLRLAHSYQLPVYEGYGLSEACSVISLNTPSKNKVGSAGKLLHHQQVTISEDGELILKQPGFLGYCGSDKPAPNVLATGDICSIDNDGYLHVVGRKKNTLITSMGRNVSPEWIESELLAEPALLQVLVRCDNDDQLVALVFSTQDDETVSENIACANNRLPSYAQVLQWSRVHPFTQPEGTLTGNGKTRRDAIDKLYPDFASYNQVNSNGKYVCSVF